MKNYKLNDNVKIPALGFGTWKLTGEECTDSVAKALEVGYRHIDTADAYGNHKEVGEGIKTSGVKREDLFITTKIPPTNLHKDMISTSANRFLEELGVDYIDLLLVHWPNKDIPMEEYLTAFNQLKKEKIIKAIGVSNFTIKHLEEALTYGVEITNNQVELHPSFRQDDLRKYCDDKKIIVTAYSPVGRGADLNIPEILELAEKYQKTVPQIIINWIMTKGMVAIPKSANPLHIEENFKSMYFELSREDIDKMDCLDQGKRLIIPAWAEFEDN